MEEIEIPTLIVGGGLCGSYIGLQLLEQNYTSFLILEAVGMFRGKQKSIRSYSTKHSEQPDILEMQAKFKKSFDELKTILQNFLEPESEEEEMAPVKEENIDEELNLEPKSNYSLSTKKEVAKPVDKFDSLFDEEDDDLPF